MYRLIIFPTPIDGHWELTHDDLGGVARIIGVPVVHPSGRPGQAFYLPEFLPLKPGQEVADKLPNGHGARILGVAKGKVDVDERGTVFLNDGILPWPWPGDQEAAWSGDDFVMQNAPVGRTLPKLVRQGQFLAQEIP